ncbi:hypothetical protein [Betafusellovirus yellowstonense]|uniref:Uncharacterized protein n=1 Tax=Betafusellovirus yellowstonense TaxID=693629 RepID=D1GF96_9VIRU|nr:hypothetical protein SSSV1_gp12 [Acidianus spindle-shaped virus 1]ACZ35797.1 hypothetical protein [Acidianus spindle-shaped virus 1]
MKNNNFFSRRFLMTVILLHKKGKYSTTTNCEPAHEVLLENGQRIKAEKVCWEENGKVTVFGNKVYVIKFGIATVVEEYDA